ncbi:hypothetical protein [Ekhidna sp.]
MDTILLTRDSQEFEIKLQFEGLSECLIDRDEPNANLIDLTNDNTSLMTAAYGDSENEVIVKTIPESNIFSEASYTFSLNGVLDGLDRFEITSAKTFYIKSSAWFLDSEASISDPDDQIIINTNRVNSERDGFLEINNQIIQATTNFGGTFYFSLPTEIAPGTWPVSFRVDDRYIDFEGKSAITVTP